jgi:uncharacterized membrane protein YeiH
VRSFAGGWVLVLAQTWSLPPWAALLAAAGTASALRVAAVLADWRLPTRQGRSGRAEWTQRPTASR